MRALSTWRISVGPAVTWTSAREETGRIVPPGVTTGSAAMPWVSTIPSSGPINIRSICWPPSVTSATRTPSLKASTVTARSCADNPASAKRMRFGTIRISGSPNCRLGRGRKLVPSLRGRISPMRAPARRAPSKISVNSKPVMSMSIDRLPPIPRPKIDG